MIIIFKKRKLLFIASVLAACALFTSLFMSHPPDSAPAVTRNMKKTIILDAGHGMPDGGAVGISGTLEEALNLDIALILEDLLKKEGYKVIMTRSDENGIYDKSSESIREKKVSDMHNREEIMNSAGGDIFVSIHMNMFTDSKYSGPQVFYAPQHEEGKELAQSIQTELISELKPAREREIKESDSGIYLLKMSKIPAVLVECGFLSNPEEEKLLKTDAYKKRTAKAIKSGITTYFSDQKNKRRKMNEK